jgi:NADH:ubiquinone oxidoreductase subunit 3 (subunit A)
MSTLLLVDNNLHRTLFLALIFSFLLSGVILALSFLLAVHAPDSEKTSAYECGFEPFEDARNRFDVRFYIVGILFLLFDVEVAFLFPWATTFGRTGLSSYRVVLAFLVLLTLGFLYEVVKGALNPQ